MKLFKKLNKGFTLVELVVVIAVIAILSAVSVVAYTGITNRARESKALTEAKAAFENAYALDMSDGKIDGVDSTKDTEDEEYQISVTTGDGYYVTGGVASYKLTFDGKVLTYNQDGTHTVA